MFWGHLMVAWALYLDETGTTDAHTVPLKPGITPMFTLAGVALPIDRWRDYDRGYLRLKREFFAKEIDASTKIDVVWEVKGSDLFAPRNAASERNKVFAYKVLDLIKEYKGRAFGVNFLKSVNNPMPRSSIYTKGLQILAERFDVFLRESDEQGIIIMDSRMAHMRKGNGVDYTVATSYLSFIFGNNEGKLLKRIVEAPMFADSGITAGLQIADIVSGMIYADVYRHKLSSDVAVLEKGLLDYSHCQKYHTPLSEVVFQSENHYGSQKMYGLRTIDHRDVDIAPKLDALKAKFSK